MTLRSLALGVALACQLSSSAPVQPEPQLPPYPAHVHTPLGKVPLIWVRDLKCGGVEALGCYDWDKRVIYIVTGRSQVATWHTIEHEKLHVVFHDGGVTFKDEASEDRACDAIATARVNEMIQTALEQQSAAQQH